MRLIRHLLAGAAVAAGLGVLPVPGPAATAQPCPDVEIVFARGTAEPPGLGGVGQAFVDAVRAGAADRTVAAYPVDYPASSDFADRIGFALTVIDGIRDAAGRIQDVAARCPDTRIVLGGFSQGAAVAGFTTADTIPAGVPPEAVPPPMPAEVADHVAAVVLFGAPSVTFLTQFGAPPIRIGARYADKTVELCAPGDTVCDGQPPSPNIAHALYPVNGMVDQGAAYVLDRLA
ncbi:cutinase family protein [uncultured Mycolicibacterium sp.]|uniref:cutinase family protein n=1 Tax=uncultured Mycolicibacterium sp. TaxID=2320817 RepID=UPI00260F6662|nr:cutinase family protein [uncultured Mycolicibacterium sp.]